MGATTFGTAVAIFVNTWLVGLTAFGIAATGIFLHILGAVDSTIGSSVLLSIVCVCYPTLEEMPTKPITGCHIDRLSYTAKHQRLAYKAVSLPQIVTRLLLCTLVSCLDRSMDSHHYHRLMESVGTTTVQEQRCQG